MIAELADRLALREVGPTSAGGVVAGHRGGYSDDELRLLLEFQGKVEEIMRSQLARLRGDERDAASHRVNAAR